MEDDEDVLVLKYQPGIGKTYNTIKTLMKEEFLLGWFGGSHRNVAENITDKYNLLHLKGKRKECQNPFKEDYINYNLLSNSHVCKTCDFNEHCEYKNKIRNFFEFPESFGAVHHHFPIFSDMINETPYDVIVFDENFLEALFIGGTLTVEDLYRTLEMLEIMPDSIDRNFMIEFVTMLLSMGLGGKYEEMEVPENCNLEEFDKAYQEFLITRLNDHQPIYYNRLTMMIKHLTLDNKKIVNKRKLLEKNSSQFVVELAQYDFDSLDINQKMIILDATTPEKLYEDIFEKFDKTIKVIEPEIIIEGHMRQLNTHAYPMSVLRHKNVRKRLFKITKDIAKVHEDKNVFVCIRKKFRNELEEYTIDSNNVIVAHYGGLRGINEYKNCDVAVLIGGPFPNPDTVKMKAYLMGVHEEYITRMELNEEMLQTIHRIRPISTTKKDTWVYVLSAVDTGYKCTDNEFIPITTLEKEIKYDLE